MASYFIYRSRSNSHYSLRCFKGKENKKTSFISSKACCSTILPIFTSHISHPLSHSPFQSLHSSLNTTVQYSTIKYKPIFAQSSSCPLFQPHCFSLYSYSLMFQSHQSYFYTLHVPNFSCLRNIVFLYLACLLKSQLSGAIFALVKVIYPSSLSLPLASFTSLFVLPFSSFTMICLGVFFLYYLGSNEPLESVGLLSALEKLQTDIASVCFFLSSSSTPPVTCYKICSGKFRFQFLSSQRMR